MSYAPPSSPPPTSAVDSSVGQYGQLVDTVAALDSELAANLPNQESYVAQLQGMVGSKAAEVAALEKRTKKEGKDAKGMKSGMSFKAIGAKLKGNYDAKLAKEEAEYMNAVQEENIAKQALAELQRQLGEATGVLNGYRAKQQQAGQLRQQIDALLERVFNGPTPDFPEEDAYENATNAAYGNYLAASQLLPTTRQVDQMLAQAQSHLSNAIRALQSADQMATVDLFSDSLFVEMAKQNGMAEARNAATAAQVCLDRARSLNPNIPNIGSLHVTQGNFLLDVAFDNVFTDMYIKQKIQKSLQDLSQSLSVLTGLVSWSRGVLAQQEHQSAQAKAAFDQARAAQTAKRVEIMNTKLGRSGPAAPPPPAVGAGAPPPMPARGVQNGYGAPPPQVQQGGYHTQGQQGGYAPPPGPPPAHGAAPAAHGSYAPPPGPPPAYAPPAGPQGGYGAPSGPPPPAYGGYSAPQYTAPGKA